MRIVKMSLVAAVAVASLSTASFADGHGGIKMSGDVDLRWKSTTTGDASANKLDRGRVNVNLTSSSKDGMGTAHANFRADNDGVLTLQKAYGNYKLGTVTLGAGSKIGFPGSFSDSTVTGLTVSTKVAGFDLGVGIADKDTGSEMDEKSIITAKGKVAIADLRLDYRLGANKMDYLATDVKVKVGPATIIGGYAAGMGDGNKDMSLMGADVSVGLGMVTAYGAFSLSGDKGGKVTELGDTSNALGNISGSMGIKTTAMKFGAKAKVAGIAVQGYYSMATPDGGDADTKIYVDAKKSLNAQSSASVHYSIATPGDTTVKATNTIELRFASKL